jgi:hypothetical protein
MSHWRQNKGLDLNQGLPIRQAALTLSTATLREQPLTASMIYRATSEFVSLRRWVRRKVVINMHTHLHTKCVIGTNDFGDIFCTRQHQYNNTEVYRHSEVRSLNNSTRRNDFVICTAVSKHNQLELRVIHPVGFVQRCLFKTELKTECLVDTICNRTQAKQQTEDLLSSDRQGELLSRSAALPIVPNFPSPFDWGWGLILFPKRF